MQLYLHKTVIAGCYYSNIISRSVAEDKKSREKNRIISFLIFASIEGFIFHYKQTRPQHFLSPRYDLPHYGDRKCWVRI